MCPHARFLGSLTFVLAAMVSAGCLESEVETCAGGAVCPAGMACAPAGSELVCVDTSLQEACLGLQEGQTCTAAGIAGFCSNELCILADQNPPSYVAPPLLVTEPERISLVWTAIDGADSYTVEVAEDPSFDAPVFSIDLAASSNFLTVPNAEHALLSLSRPVTYWWRVRSDKTSQEFSADYPAASFDVLDDIVYVHCDGMSTSCDDAGQVGNLSKPMRTIRGGLQAAGAHSISEVRVAARGGDDAYEEAVTLVEGVSLLGGFDATFSGRDWVASPTIIQSEATSVVTAADLGAEGTTFDGFTVRGGGISLAYAAGLSVSSVDALEVRNSRFLGRPASSVSRGVSIVESGNDASGAGVVVEDCTIEAGEVLGYAYGVSTGLYASDSGVVIRGNDIRSGQVTTGDYLTGEFASVGVKIERGSADLEFNDIVARPVIRGPGLAGDRRRTTIGIRVAGDFSEHVSAARVANNTVRIGAAQIVWGGFFQYADDTVVTNNTFFVDGSDSEALALYGLLVERTVADVVNNLVTVQGPAPSSLSRGLWIKGAPALSSAFHNVLAGFECALRLGTTCYDADLDIQGAITGGLVGGAGNAVLPSVESIAFSDLNNGDYHLTQASHASVRRGGKDATETSCGPDGDRSCGDVLLDRDGLMRSCPTPFTNCYSVGAYEFD